MENNHIIEYTFIIEYLTVNNDNGNKTYKCTYKKNEEIEVDERNYIYQNNLDVYDTTNIESYINDENNNVIVFFLDDAINKYLYDNLLTNTIYHNLSELNNKLKMGQNDYNEINSIIQNQIDNALSNIKTILNAKFENIKNERRNKDYKPFYIQFRYNKYTYYPYIDDIREYIKSKIQAIFRINLDF